MFENLVKCWRNLVRRISPNFGGILPPVFLGHQGGETVDFGVMFKENTILYY